VTRYVESLVVTETGPGHCKDGQLNQDACLCSKGQYGRLIVVSDGLGSRPRADHGSKNACLAARDAVRYWSANPLSPPERLAPLIQALWRARIAPHPPEDCATTCILALRQQT
jgi:Protein phosphatase 2C